MYLEYKKIKILYVTIIIIIIITITIIIKRIIINITINIKICCRRRRRKYNIYHPIGLEPINIYFEGKRCTNSAKDVTNKQIMI